MQKKFFSILRINITLFCFLFRKKGKAPEFQIYPNIIIANI